MQKSILSSIVSPDWIYSDIFVVMPIVFAVSYGTFYIFDEAVSVPFLIEETDDSPYRLSYVSNGNPDSVIYWRRSPC